MNAQMEAVASKRVDSPATLTDFLVSRRPMTARNRMAMRIPAPTSTEWLAQGLD